MTLRSMASTMAIFLALPLVCSVAVPRAGASDADPGRQRLRTEISAFAAGLPGFVAPKLRVELVDAAGTARSVIQGDEVRLGSQLRLCFAVTRPGYVSVWSRDASAKPVRIYPNRYMPGAEARRAMPVDAGERCIGDQDTFIVRLGGDPGWNATYVHWTESEMAQPAPEDYVDIDALSHDVEDTPFKGTWFEFEAVP